MSGAPFVTHLECSETSERYAPDELQGVSRTGQPLMVRYDLDAVARAVSRDDLRRRDSNMWRYRELLPVSSVVDAVSLGEITTPLVLLPHVSKRLGVAGLMVKDEGRLPTGSFKARGLAVAITMARDFGKTRLAIPTAGNAGAAAAAYGARAGMETFVFTPEDTPEVTVREIGFHGARVFRVNGLVNECARIVREGAPVVGWHNLTTLEEPYRLEGKKTMGFELAEQLEWSLPDVVYYPTGGGTGFIGMWKAFQELASLGWLRSKKSRMVAVQTTGCHPVVRAFEEGKTDVDRAWEPVETRVHGVRVPKPLGGRLMLSVINESGGFATAVSDEEVDKARGELIREDGVHLCPEGALCFAAYCKDLADGRLDSRDRVVLFNTATGLKSPMPSVEGWLDARSPIDFGQFE